MKRSFLFILVVAVLYSCSQDEPMPLEDTQLQFKNQKWELFRMTGDVEGTELTGEQMEWQEYYLFKLDGTFEKVREREGAVSKASGSFEVVEYNNDDSDYLELSYATGLELMGNCSGDSKEVLVYRTTTMISNTWLACDGPGLDYSLVQD